MLKLQPFGGPLLTRVAAWRPKKSLKSEPEFHFLLLFKRNSILSDIPQKRRNPCPVKERIQIVKYVRLSNAPRVRIRSNHMMSIKWAIPVRTELLIIKISRPFAAKSAASWAMKKCFLHGANLVHTRISALLWASSVHVFAVKTTV